MEHVGNQLRPCGFAGNNRIRRRLKIPVPKWWQASRNYKHFVHVKIYTLSAEVLVGDFFGCNAYSLLGVVWCLIYLIMISEFQGISWIPQNRSGNRVVCCVAGSSKRHCEERSYGKVLHHGKWKAGIVVMVICMFCNVCIIILYSQLICFIKCVHLTWVLSLLRGVSFLAVIWPLHFTPRLKACDQNYEELDTQSPALCKIQSKYNWLTSSKNVQVAIIAQRLPVWTTDLIRYWLILWMYYMYWIYGNPWQWIILSRGHHLKISSTTACES